MEVIRCSGLTKRYGRVTAVDGLDLSIGQSEVFGLLGPNGSGKTTTLRMLVGLIRPTSGEAWVNGRQLPDPAGLAGIGSVIEEPAFYPWMTGRANLAIIGLSGPPLPAQGTIDAVLGQVGLTDVADRKVKEYSQGMRQRLGIAVALMRRPGLLLLDEPTNGMDPAAIRDFRSLLGSLSAVGTTVVLSSHLLAEVEQICERVAIIDGGKLVAQGRVSDLVAAGRRVRVVLADGDQPRARTLLARWSLRTDGPVALIVEGAYSREVMTVFAEGGLIAHEVAAEGGSLEAAFLRLTSPAGLGSGRHAEGRPAVRDNHACQEIPL